MNFTGAQLTRILLALSMSGQKEITCLTQILDPLREMMDKLDKDGIFQICIALQKGNIDLSKVEHDILYLLIKNLTKLIDQYNLYDLSLILTLLSDPRVNDVIPETFWSEDMDRVFDQSIANLAKYKDEISPELYLADFIKCLVSHQNDPDRAVREKFWTKISSFILEHFEHVPEEQIESLIFAFYKSNVEIEDLWKAIFKTINEKEMIQRGLLNDINLIYSIAGLNIDDE